MRPLHDRILLGLLCVPTMTLLMKARDRFRRGRWRPDPMTWREAFGWGLAGGVGSFLVVTYLR